MISFQQTDNGQAIDGRELHSILSVPRDFPTWFQDRITKFGYVEGYDFKEVARVKADTPKRDYLLSLPMAAELSLIQRTDTGLTLRRFILAELTKTHVGGVIDGSAPTLKACKKCRTPFTAEGETCLSCQAAEKRELERQERVSNRQPNSTPAHPFIECLIEREGDTVLVPHGSRNHYTFRRNEKGHAVCKVEDPRDYAAILKSSYYRPYYEGGRA